MKNIKHDSQIITIPNARNLCLSLVMIKDNQIHINVSYESIGLELRDMDFSIRVLSAIEAQNITTLERLLEYTIFDLKMGKYMGRRTLQEIQTTLRDHELRLKKKFQDNIIPDSAQLHEIFISQHGFQKTIHQLAELDIKTVGTLKKLIAKADNEVISNEMAKKFEEKLIELSLM